MSYTVAYHESEKIAQKAGEWLTRILNEHAHSPILLLLSGGSALDILQYVATPDSATNITLTVLDERYSFNPKVNNFLQLLTSEFYSRFTTAGSRTINTSPLSGESRDQLAERFDAKLKAWKETNPTGVVIVTQGIGPDGHTSGILPFPEAPETFGELFENKNKWTIGYSAESKNPFPERVTTTLPFLRDIIDISLVYIAGEGKRPALEAALAPNTEPATTPAAIIQQMKNVTIFTDIQL